jgi:hypothetical protein
MAARKWFGLPVIGTVQNLSVMIGTGASMWLTCSSLVEKSAT